jgi:branched-subunit amino acid transport protein AzlD
MGELSYALAMIAVMAAATVPTRALPFLLLRGRENHPLLIYLARVLPGAVMTILVLYALRTVQVLDWPHGLPELLSVVLTAGLHLWRGNALLSIGAGTGLYMSLAQTGILG